MAKTSTIRSKLGSAHSRGCFVTRPTIPGILFSAQTEIKTGQNSISRQPRVFPPDFSTHSHSESYTCDCARRSQDPQLLGHGCRESIHEPAVQLQTESCVSN